MTDESDEPQDDPTDLLRERIERHLNEGFSPPGKRRLPARSC